MNEGVCPECSSMDLEYGVLELNATGEEVGHSFVCNACGYEGIEWYFLTYITTVKKGD